MIYALPCPPLPSAEQAADKTNAQVIELQNQQSKQSSHRLN